MKLVTLFCLAVLTLGVSACGSTPEKPSNADYERQKQASDRAMQELERETSKH